MTVRRPTERKTMHGYHDADEEEETDRGCSTAMPAAVVMTTVKNK